ncbi:hypothetical protein LCL97_03230 [Seohaeicola saemankumensis]|nr:hypothetical protein [Seohaeicola saemankumensis]MCA0869827.1 hypothetical protein [Seohaeicola saemankumensis]
MSPEKENAEYLESQQRIDYGDAEQLILEARDNRAKRLDLSGYHHLSRFPPAIKDFNSLRMLKASGTKIFDLGPLQGISSLEFLDLNGSNAHNLEPLKGMSKLAHLTVANTRVMDLTPVRDLRLLRFLDLEGTEITDLEPLRTILGLRTLGLSRTPASDLSPISGLDKLQILTLIGSDVADLSPLRKLVTLQNLQIANSKVLDLRPLRDLPFARSSTDAYIDLSYSGTPATRADPRLAELSEIGDNEERTQKTLAYLRTLPEPPAPLPWDIPDIDPNNAPPDPPAPDAVPRVSWTGEQIDLVHSPLSEADQSDPIKRRMFDRLRDTLDDLKRIGNRYPELDGPARRLHRACAGGFDDADLLDIHLEIAALTDIAASNDTRPQAERIAPEDLDIVRRTTRLGPPLTLGHPDVDLFEARNAEYAQRRPPATVPHSERLVAGALARDTPMTDRARETAERVAEVPDEGRLAAFRSSFVKNALLQGVGFYFAGLVGQIGQTHTIQLAEFLVANKDAILTVALSWGEQGHIWAADLIARSQEMLRLWRHNSRER